VIILQYTLSLFKHICDFSWFPSSTDYRIVSVRFEWDGFTLARILKKMISFDSVFDAEYLRKLTIPVFN